MLHQSNVHHAIKYFFAALTILFVSAPANSAALPEISADGKYVLIGWNDLGMHCISSRFAEMAILPPFNNIHAVVIRRSGEEPSLMTRGATVSYAMINNTTVTGKTDFWTYSKKLFGANLTPGIGLTGNGLSGTMGAVGDQFIATGIPALPYYDNKAWNPLQMAYLTLTVGTKKVAATSIVVPVSDEMNCVKCHQTGGIAARKVSTPTVEGNILTTHDQREGTHLMASRPVLCASCHSDNALGTKGVAGVRSLSYAMHVKHSWSNPQPACYDCHPGTRTQCNRSAATSMGPLGSDPRCDNCHGDLDRQAASLRAGRIPWVNEPTCSSCHGMAYDTAGVLYRNAKGHGGVYCVTCHNSPHAWYPSLRRVDNAQPLTLQGTDLPLGANKCSICHTDGRTGRMPPHSGD